MKTKISLFSLLLLFCCSQTIFSQIVEPVKWKTSINDNSELVLRASIDKGWHLYDMNLPEGGPYSTEFTFENIEGAELVGKVFTSSKITSQYDEMFSMELRWFENVAVFVQKIKITNPDKFKITGEISYMACDDAMCLPPTIEVFEFSKNNLPASLTNVKSSDKKNDAKENDLSEETKTIVDEIIITDTINNKIEGIIADIKEETDTPDWWKPVIEELQNYGSKGSTFNEPWWVIFLLGFGGGLIALLTPCVWPMIPMTVSFFLKKSKSDRKKAVKDAITYGLSIIIIYLTLGLLITGIFGASALNELSTSAVFNLIFFALLVIFAISFFGAFEMTLPASWTTKLDSKADASSGILSIFFMAFTLVLVSFSCTGPIIGTLLVEAASMGNIAGPAIGMFGFALALSIPFALFAMFPSMLQSMPKSGGWLNSVKVVLGFLELALALKFLSVADLAYGWGILDREVFLVLWIVIFILLGVYLLGKIKFAHDSELNYVSVPRLFMAIISFAFAIYMIPGLWGAPLKAISAFSPPLYTQDFNLYNGEVHPQFLNYEQGMQRAKETGKPVMVDFTGYGCVNCREMEASVWSDPRVKNIIDNNYVLISLYVDDKTPLPKVIEIEEYGKIRKLKTIGDKWSYLQRSKFGANAQPFYVLLDNDGTPIAPSYAYNKNIEEYIKYLNKGLEEYKR